MASSGKIDEARINQVLALIVDMDIDTFSILVHRIYEEYYKRNQGRNIDTVQT